MFLLDKKDMTRVDEDFVFYNNETACEGAIKHMGDNRAGTATAGDNENFNIDLNGIPFDILKIVFVLSVYDPDLVGKHFGMIKNIYFRIFNQGENEEMVRYRLNPDDHKGGNGMVVGTMIREGPKWIFEANTEISNGGLAKIATQYGLIIKELQSTGEETFGEKMDAKEPEQ